MFEVEGFVDPRGMSASELTALVHELDRQYRLVEAAFAAVVAEADRSGAFREDGHASVAGWLRASTRCSNVEVTHRRRVAELAAASEVFAGAVGCGAIGVAQARELGRVYANTRCGSELLEDLDRFVARADRVPFGEFRERLAGWLVTHDRDGAHRDRDWGHQQREAWMTIFDGVGHGGFTGGAADVVVMSGIFERFRDAEFAADWDATVAAWGDAACAELMPRTGAQRSFDALRAIFEHAAARDGDGGPGPDPLVELVVDIHTVDALVNTEPVTSPADPWWRRCQTRDGTTLAPAEVLAAMWWGQIRAVVVDSAGVVVSMGRRRRLFTGAARDAVLLQSSRCVWPGCDQPSGRCQADHLTAWTHHGPTDQHNGAPLCPRHNRWKHHGYTTRRDPDGTWHTHRPDHTEID